jgi:superfamily II DNA helicase RecQ
MKEKGISAAALTSKTTEDDPELFRKAFIKCEFQMVYTSPEYLLKPGGEFMSKILPNPKSTFISRLITVAVDECHVALDWQGFRPKYKELFRLKACMHNIPWVCLSATLPPHYSRYVRRHLRLRNAVVVKHTVRRINIRLLVSKIRSPDLKELNILVPTTPSDIPPTPVYCDDKQTVRLIATHLRQRLLEAQSLKDESLVRVYHSAIDEEPRKVFMDELKTGKSKFLICTDACGMGVDLRIIKRVVQWKLSSQVKLTNLWQRFGRGGRDCNINAVAILFAQKNLFLEPTDDAIEEEEDYIESANIRKSKKKKSNLCERSYYEKMRHPVTSETRDVTRALMQELWDQDPIAQTSPPKCSTSWKAIDPALIHFINTQGCRHKCVLAYLDDDDIYGKEGHGCCDNCMVDEFVNSGRTCADPTLQDISFSISETYTQRSNESAIIDASEMAAEEADSNLTDEELFVKVSKQRLDILEEDIRTWRKTTWRECPVRSWLLERDFLTDKEITRIRRNASTIDAEKQLKQVLGMKSHAGGLSHYIQDLFQLIEQSLGRSEHLQLLPVLSPSPVRRPMVELSPTTSSQAAIRFPWLKRSADVDEGFRAEERQNREERHAKRMKNVQVAKPKKR